MPLTELGNDPFTRVTFGETPTTAQRALLFAELSYVAVHVNAACANRWFSPEQHTDQHRGCGVVFIDAARRIAERARLEFLRLLDRYTAPNVEDWAVHVQWDAGKRGLDLWLEHPDGTTIRLG